MLIMGRPPKELVDVFSSSLGKYFPEQLVEEFISVHLTPSKEVVTRLSEGMSAFCAHLARNNKLEELLSSALDSNVPPLFKSMCNYAAFVRVSKRVAKVHAVVDIGDSFPILTFQFETGLNKEGCFLVNKIIEE